MNQEFSYTIRKSKRAKRMRLTVHRDGRVVLTAPFSVRRSLVDKFVSDKRQWIVDKLRIANSTKRKPIRPFSRADYMEHKDAALIFAKERVESYNKVYNYPFNKICIKNQKTRWGSCSRKKNINLNYKILFLPKDLQDYIVVHEICHLKELNHSQDFWALVAETLPNHVERRKELRKYELS